MAQTILGALLGILAGVAAQRLAVLQIQRRTDDYSKVESVNTISVAVLFALVAAAAAGIVYRWETDLFVRAEYLIYILVVLDIAIVDIDIRKIPNSSLIILLVVRVGSIIAGLINGEGFKSTVVYSIIGLAVGFVLFILPSFVHIKIGSGDIKYCACIGFCLGIYGFLESALVMGIVVGCYAIYLYASKKGSMKTMLAMGPYLTIGVLVTLMLPLQKFIEMA